MTTYNFQDLDSMEDMYGDICHECHLPSEWHPGDMEYCVIGSEATKIAAERSPLPTNPFR